MTTNTDLIATLVDDMFFNSKINGAAAECGRRIERIKSREQLEGLSDNPPALILIDLNSGRVDPIKAIEFLKSHAELKKIPIVSFVSHVQTDLIDAARTAGSDYVIPRSVFTQTLTEAITGNLSSLARFAREN
jgi:Response regulator containing a CheY-like receiver domain and an HTH DNA-binding domain